MRSVIGLCTRLVKGGLNSWGIKKDKAGFVGTYLLVWESVNFVERGPRIVDFVSMYTVGFCNSVN